MRQPVLAALCLLVAQSFSSAAHAGIEIRIDPDQVRQCRSAHFFASIGNDSSEPMEVDVTVSMVHGYRHAEVSLGHFVIAAGESHVEEFDFVMPRIDLGKYEITMRADLADQSSMEGSSRFSVCTRAKTGCPQGDDFLSILASNFPDETPITTGNRRRTDLQFDATSSTPSTTSETTWQAYKMLYR